MFRRLRQAWNRRTDATSTQEIVPEEAAEGRPPEQEQHHAEGLGEGPGEALETLKPSEDELILTVNGQRYRLNQLPEEIRQLVADLQKADELIALRTDTLETLRTGRNRLRRQLGSGLAAQPPLPERPTSA